MSYPRKPTPLKFCAHCEREMGRRRYPSGRLETLAKFHNRQYCDPWCAKEAQSATPELRPLAASRPRKAKRKNTAKLDAAQIRAAHKLYEAGMSAAQLAEAGWRRWGYKNAETAEAKLRSAFRLEGLPTRTISEANLVRLDQQRCRGCGVPARERTVGCAPCHGRHWYR